MVASLLSQSEVDYIKAGCLEDCRVDGRSCREFRHHNVLVSSSISSSTSALLVRSNGSSRILLDGAHILCSVKADIVRPPENRPNHGSLEVSVERHPHASGSGTVNKKSRHDDDVLQQLLEDLFLPHLLDLTSLCLVRGEFAWRLAIDVLVLAGAGGGAGPGALLDAASIAVSAALRDTWLPAVTVVAKDDAAAHPKRVGEALGSSHLGLRSDDASSATAELVVEGDMAKAKRVFDLRNDNNNNNPSTSNGQPPSNESGVQLVTVTIVKCYATRPAAHEPPAPRFVCLLDATNDEVACSHCQVHVAVRTAPRSSSAADDKDPPASSSSSSSSSSRAASVCAVQTSGRGSVHLSLISEATQLALQAAAGDRSRCVEVTDLSLLTVAASSSSSSAADLGGARSRNDETMLQELYALQ